LLSQTAAPLIEAAAAAGLGVVIGAPLATGLLAGGDELPRRYGSLSRQEDADVQAALRLRAWAKERGLALPALALQWILRNPHVGVILAGAVSPAEVEESVRAVTAPVPDGLWAEWESAEGRSGE
jgi:aryl-alcohol dehydrogenase-like predicted oxidoreductase